MKSADIADRMKMYERQYASQQLLPLIPLCARIDGRAFHTFTSDLKRPYDERLSNLFVETTRFLVAETGARIGYTQSDEISLVWLQEDFKSEIFFDGKLLKLTSILASLTTAFFNKKIPEYFPQKADTLAIFDTRIWSVPVPFEAVNYLIWREMDATRNSVSMAAQSMFTHSELHGKSRSEMQEMMFKEHGINWNDYPDFFKRGTYVQKRQFERPYSVDELEALPPKHHARKNPDLRVVRQEVVRIDLPPITRIANRTEVLLEGALPVQKPDLVEGAV